MAYPLFSFFFLFMIHFCGASDIAVVSMAIGENYQELVAAGTKNKQAYCTLHGYDFINLTTNLDESRPVAWNKILILQILNCFAQLIIYLIKYFLFFQLLENSPFFR